jgi:guanylate kinase
MKAAHKLIVITGATGTGKTTVSGYLRDNYRIHRVMTHTTRPARTGEKNGVDYYFETPASFATKHLSKKSLMLVMSTVPPMNRLKKTGLSIPSLVLF